MIDSKNQKKSSGFPSLRHVLKNGPDHPVDLSLFNEHLEGGFQFPSLTYLRKTPEGLQGVWRGTAVRISTSSPCYRGIGKTLKVCRVSGPEKKIWSFFFPVFCGRDWVGCVAVGRGGEDKEGYSFFCESWLPLLSWAVGMVLENQELGKMLERADRHSSLGFLSAGLFHEIRNPLTALSTLIQLLPLKKNDTAFMNSFQALMLKELDRLDLLTDQSLKFVRTDVLDRQGVGLSETLDRIYQLFRPSLGRKKVLLQRVIEPGLRLKVDPFQFESLVVNLLKNALSAVGEKGFIQICVKRVNLGNEKEKPWTCLMIKDNGKGITPLQMKRIFDPYFTTRNGGTGLGLAICRRVLDNHDGILKVKSKLGKGTTFSALFPSHLSMQ